MATNGNPYTNFTYEVRIDDETVGGFTRIEGIGAQSSVVEYQEGGLHDVTHTFPTDVTYSNITLYRGMSDDDRLMEWIMQSMSDAKEEVRSKISIAMKDKEDETKWTWVLLGAHPVRWHGPELASNGHAMQSGQGLSIEQLELSYETLDTRTA